MLKGHWRRGKKEEANLAAEKFREGAGRLQTDAFSAKKVLGGERFESIDSGSFYRSTMKVRHPFNNANLVSVLISS